jgi:hypothetical protein
MQLVQRQLADLVHTAKDMQADLHQVQETHQQVEAAEQVVLAIRHLDQGLRQSAVTVDQVYNLV